MKLYIDKIIKLEQLEKLSQVVCVEADGNGNYNAATYEKIFPNFIPLYKKHLATILSGNSTVQNYSHCFFTDNGTVRPFQYKRGEGSLYHLFVGGKFCSIINAESVKTQYLDDLFESMIEVRDYMRFFKENRLWIPWKDSGLDMFCFEDVRNILDKVFNETEMEIYISQIENE